MAATSWFFYYQQSGEDAWIPSMAHDREKIVQDKKPRYSTVLDVDTNFGDEASKEDALKAHYRGDMYIDIDVSKEMGGIHTAIKQVNHLLDNLKLLGVNPQALRIFASGSKGFHVEIPTAIFLSKESRTGYQKLPLIYKEVVHRSDIYVDGIDPRVYSAGRGRQWRTTNVQRENGRYKVPISYLECLELSSEKYDEYVSAPRPAPPLAEPVYCPALATAFAIAQDNVEKRVKNSAKSKLDPAQVARWAKRPPADLQSLMAGRHIKEGAGFHPIAIQVALAATTFGWSVDEMIERCEGLIENHVGDGNRYDSPGKRRRELIRMWYYYEGGSGTFYEFALAPIKALVSAPQTDGDLPPDSMEGPDGETPEEGEDDHDSSLTAGVKIRKWGLFKTVEGVEMRASAIGFANFTQMVEVAVGEVTGYQVEMFLDGKSQGMRLMPLTLFSSKNAFQQFALANGGASVHLSDAQVIGMAEIFRRKAMNAGKQIHLVGREGLDFIRQQDGTYHTIYVSHEEAFAHTPNGDNRTYALKLTGKENAPLESDVLHAPALTGSDEEREFLTHLLQVNRPGLIGKMIGWFSAAFACQGIRAGCRQFPLLHVYGTAGAGKTKTCELLINLHYHMQEPEVAMATMLTPFAMKTRLAGSASIPLIWDEVKFHKMTENAANNLAQFLRNNYVGAKSEAGMIRRDSGQSYVDLRAYINAAPLVFIGETMETETAIAERYVAVGLTKQDRRGRQASFNHCFSRRHILGRFGKHMIRRTMLLDVEEMKAKIAAYEAQVARQFGDKASDDSRRVFNYAVALYGLEMFADTVHDVFGEEFNSTLQGLAEGIVAGVQMDLPTNRSEASKVLDTLAYLTKKETPDGVRMVYGTDYIVDDIKGTVDLKLLNCFNKYLMHCRSLGTKPLFPEYDRFVAAMQKHPAIVDVRCLDSVELKDSARVDVYRFSVPILTKEEVDEFRS